jgi:hypothetical protein
MQSKKNAEEELQHFAVDGPVPQVFNGSRKLADRFINRVRVSINIPLIIFPPLLVLLSLLFWIAQGFSTLDPKLMVDFGVGATRTTFSKEC